MNLELFDLIHNALDEQHKKKEEKRAEAERWTAVHYPANEALRVCTPL